MRSGASSSRGHQDMVVEGRVGGDDVGVPSRLDFGFAFLYKLGRRRGKSFKDERRWCSRLEEYAQWRKWAAHLQTLTA